MNLVLVLCVFFLAWLSLFLDGWMDGRLLLMPLSLFPCSCHELSSSFSLFSFCFRKGYPGDVLFLPARRFAASRSDLLFTWSIVKTSSNVFDTCHGGGGAFSSGCHVGIWF